MRAVDPGFRSDHVVAMMLDLPDAQYPDVQRLRIEGVDRMPRGSSIDEIVATPGSFSALGIDLVSGRAFTRRDDAAAPGVAIISPVCRASVLAAGRCWSDRAKAGHWP